MPGAFQVLLERARRLAQLRGCLVAVLVSNPAAFAARSIARSTVAAKAATAAAMREDYDAALADARQALALAPDLAQAHLALAAVAENGTLDFTQASAAYDRALTLAPGNAQVLRNGGLFAARVGHFFPEQLLASQLAALEPPGPDEHVIRVVPADTPAATVDAIIALLWPGGPPGRDGDHEAEA